MKKTLSERFPITAEALRIILIVLGSIFSIAILTLSIFAMMELMQNNLQSASHYLLWIFVALGLSRFITFIRERTKISLIRFLLLLFLNVGIGITILFAKDQPYLYSLCGGLYCITIIISRLLKIIQKPTVRRIVFNTIIIAFMGLTAVALFIPSPEDTTNAVIMFICGIVAISALLEVFSNATGHIKLKVLMKIILKTYALEILLGLVTLIVAFSLVFMFIEDDITNFPDALWYSFAVVTTIGFGDVKVHEPISRILSVILGIYGILVVAVITSIIVNLYNETSGKKDTEEIKDVLDEAKKEHEKEQLVKKKTKK